MRTTPFNRVLARLYLALFIALAAAGSGLLLPHHAQATPIEEDIPQSSAPRHPRAQPAAPPALAAEPPAAPRSEVTAAPAALPDEVRDQPARTSANLPEVAQAAPRQPHKYFPYTIRPGDTLNAIAELFGVQVADITRANRRIADDNLMAGDTIRIPNPFLARESELNAEVERLSIDKHEAERKAEQATNALASLHSQLETAAASNERYERDLSSLPWWRTATWTATITAAVMFGVMLAALIEWLILRSRYRAVAEMNDSLRRLDYRYRMLMAKAELRLQELYGRRRRGIEDGQERPKIPEEIEIERLDLQLKEILERHLARLGPPGNRARRARWRELIGAVGAPIEARSARR